MFRVYHEGALQGTTLITNYTVGGLLPCQQYQAKVEALCGDSVLMSAETISAHTGNVETDEKAEPAVKYLHVHPIPIRH